MKKIILITIAFLMLFVAGFSQNNNAPVLKKELVGKYEGDQKKGLAQGKGTASGTDTYTGEFKKGLPDGIGVYTDSQGNVYKGAFREGLKEGKGEFIPAASSTEKPMTGYWMDDKYVGKEKVEPYEVSNKVGSVSPRIYSTGPGNVIDITVVDPYDNSNVAANIYMTGQANSREDSSYHKYFYEDCKFPIEFDIRYQVRQKMGGINGSTALSDNSVHIKIVKPGKWSITLKN
jgi:hypothetical protein